MFPYQSVGLAIVYQGERNIGTSAEALAASATPAQLVYLSAKSGNTGSIFVGDSTVTASNGSDDVTTGLELEPGDTIMLPCEDVSTLYAVAATDNDDVFVLAYG